MLQRAQGALHDALENDPYTLLFFEVVLIPVGTCAMDFFRPTTSRGCTSRYSTNHVCKSPIL